MSRLVTHADVSAVPDGGVLYLEPDAQLTPLAAERVRARGITVQRIDEVVSRYHPVGPELADRVVAEVLAALREGSAPTAGPGVADAPPISGSMDYCAAYLEQEKSRARRRAVITTTGRNQRGIVARLTSVIAELGGDILDISQTLVSDYFTMILVVDTATLGRSFDEFKAAIERTAGEIGIQAMVMHEDLVTSLNRV